MRTLLAPLRGRVGKNKEYYRIIREVFGVVPDNIELYKLALIHRSASFVTPEGVAVNNERLEFLGDSILESIITDYLFTEFPGGDEGFMTQMRSKLVSRATLNQLAVDIGLDHYIITHQHGGNHIQKHLNGDALEAMIGAIYLDKGFDFTNRLIINKVLRQHIDLDDVSHTETDYKSRLIEWAQRSRQEIRFDTGFAEDSSARNPRFRSAVNLDGREVGFGKGNTKKEAEQNAAYVVWNVISDEESDHILDKLDRYKPSKE